MPHWFRSIIISVIVLCALNARADAVFDTKAGRWLQRDPAEYMDGSNLYEYTMANPSHYCDPYGLASSAGSGDSTTTSQPAAARSGYRRPPEGCCTITIVLHVPSKVPATLLENLEGHSGMGVGNDYYDWGPAEPVPPEDLWRLLRPSGVPGAPWWDDPRNTTTDDIIDRKRREFTDDGGLVVITVFATPEQCDQASKCWKSVYDKYDLWMQDPRHSKPVPYSAYQQCSSRVVECVPGGVLNPSDATAKDGPAKGAVTPRSIKDAADAGAIKHTCGDSAGKPAGVETLKSP